MMFVLSIFQIICFFVEVSTAFQTISTPKKSMISTAIIRRRIVKNDWSSNLIHPLHVASTRFDDNLDFTNVSESSSSSLPSSSSVYQQPQQGVNVEQVATIEILKQISKSNHDSILYKNLDDPQQQEKESTQVEVLQVSSTVSIPQTESDYKLLVYDLSIAGVIGVVTGTSVAIFKLLIESLRLEAYSFPFLVEPLFAALVPAFGGLMVGILALFGKFPPGLRGIIKETDQDSKALFSNIDENTPFNPFAFMRKTLAAIATLGTGCSLGPEGPSVEIGVNLSRGITTILNPQKYLPTSVNVVEVMKHNRLLLACGGAAGVAAGFSAPIAGIFFALEVIQTTFRSFSSTTTTKTTIKPQSTVDEKIIIVNERDVDDNLLSTKGGISSIVLSSVLAALVCEAILGNGLVFKVTEYSLKTPLLELPLYLLLGSLSGVLAFLFSQLNNSSKQLFDGELGSQPIRDIMKGIPSVVKPMIGGLFCGIVGMYYPQILFFGYETLNNLLTKTSLSTELLVTLLAVKMIATSVASGSGLVGGTFAPSLFFGGMLGASFHNVFELFFQNYGHGLADVPAYAMIGSASVLAALFRAPLTASLLLFECTREYEIILPLMASAGLASVVADMLEGWSTSRDESTVQIRNVEKPKIATDAIISDDHVTMK